MKTMRHAVAAAAAGALALGLLPGSAPTAQAAYIVTFTQNGNDVVATGSGTLNVSGLSYDGGSSPGGAKGTFVYSGNGSSYQLYEGTGPTAGGGASYDQYGIISSGPALGPVTANVRRSATSGSGDAVAINGGPSGSYLIVPLGYTSGAELSSTATWANTTISDLGLAAGTYVWNWGSGATADSYTLNVESSAASVPEPSAMAMLLLPMLLTGMIASRRKAPCP